MMAVSAAVTLRTEREFMKHSLPPALPFPAGEPRPGMRTDSSDCISD